MILAVKNLKKYFPIESGIFKATKSYNKAVDDISFSLEGGQILGVVGESGCGKTTLAKLLLKLIPATSGDINYGPEVTNLRKDIGIVFQDPYQSLNPRMRIKETLLEPLIIHKIPKQSEQLKELLDLVELSEIVLTRYPRQLSGGERQRVCLARALAVNPKLLILDEPISSLDLIIQKQILKLLIDLRNKLGMSYIFVTHNIAVVHKISSDIIVMFGGKIVEQGKLDSVFNNPQSDYTRKLLQSAQ